MGKFLNGDVFLQVGAIGKVSITLLMRSLPAYFFYLFRRQG
jgi:hypothetical protein